MTVAVDYDPFQSAELQHTYPSTEAQRELWTVARLGREASCAFNESLALQLRGPLQLAALSQAVQQLVRRHEALRSTFSPFQGQVCVAATSAVPFLHEDLTTLDEAQRQARLQAVRAEEVETPFDLEHGPLLRVRCLRLQPEEHWLTLTAHHIVCDGWSLGVLLRDLAALYTGGASLPPPQSHCDYARWLAAQHSSDAYRRAESYWLQQLQGELPILDLPLDRQRPPFKTYASLRCDRILSAALVNSLKQAGARHGCSLFATLLAAYFVWLHRLTGQRDLLVGVPAAGQPSAAMNDVVGHCVQLLPLRCRVEPAEPFAALLQRVRPVVLDSMEHQLLTWGSLLQKLRVPRDPSRTPLVAVLFNLDQALAGADLKLAELTAQVHSNPRHFENAEIFINAAESAGQLVLECQYNTDLFETATIAAWLDAFETLLAGIAADTAVTVGRLPLLSTAQQQRLLVEWNATALDYPQAQTLPELLAAQAQRTPERCAVVFGDSTLTYAELHRRANQLARHLATLGVTAGVRVGLCLERSLDMLVSVLAIHKAGGAYVPLDPTYPAERLAFVLQDVQAAVLVTHARWLEALPAPTLPIVCLDRDAAAIAAQATEPLASPATARDLAYIIYTSGSTGRPKGVQVAHGNVINLLASIRREPGLTAADVVLAVTTLGFDVSVAELFLPLALGAKIVLASQDDVGDGRALLRLLREQGVTLLQATPATWRLLLEAGWDRSPGLTAIVTGEALPRDLAAVLLERGVVLWDLYGPTETTVWSTGQRIVSADAIRIGRPLANTQAYILDAQREPVPVGVPGELYIGGAGVALGYWQRPELTAERFVANPFHDPFAAYLNPALYRTGDLVRWRNDGTLEYLGRNDFQVKIRGHRIELGEIEAVLVTHPSVKQAIVLAREDRPGDVRLVAYLAPHPGRGATVTEWRAHVRARLPEYMLPQHFVELDSLPLNSNGKVDRKQLPSPYGAAALVEEYAAPQTPVEQYLARVWQEALALPRSAGRHDNFFNLGGHSLLAFRVLARIAQETGVQLAPRALIVQTLAQLAAELPPEQLHSGAALPQAPAVAEGWFGKLRGWLGTKP